MAYTLRLTNGNILVTLPDQQSDNVTTSLTLIGKNVNAYGTDINQNYIRLLENFANQTAPTSPLIGQLWFDTIAQQLKVFNSNRQFKTIGKPLISDTVPSTISVGDFWYDTITQQLKFQRDASTIVTIGPELNAAVGKTGLLSGSYQSNTATIFNTEDIYANGNLIGIVSDKNFTIDPSNTSTTLRNISVGINPVYDANVSAIWNGTATYANYVMLNGSPVSPDYFLLDRSPFIEIVNPLVIASTTSSASLTIGSNNDFQFYADPSANTATLYIGGLNENFDIKTNGNTATSIHVNGTTGAIGIFTDSPTTAASVSENPNVPQIPVNLDIAGTVLIRNNLIVNGTQTSIKTADLGVIDNNIVLGWSTSTVLDSAAIGGGLILRGATNKTITWDTNWNFSDSVNVSTGTSYKIGGQTVLTNTTLSSSVVTAAGLTQVGKLTSATISQLQITQTGAYATTIGIDPTVSTSATIIIGDSQTTSIDFADKKVTNVPTPLPSNLSDAANVQFVLNAVNTTHNLRAITNMDVTGHGTSPTDPSMDLFVIQMLGIMLNPSDPVPYTIPNDTIAKVMCVRYSSSTVTNVISNSLDFGVPVTVDKGGIQNSASVVGYNTSTKATITVPASALLVNRCIKQYIVVNGSWNAYITTGTSNVIYTDGSW